MTGPLFSDALQRIPVCSRYALMAQRVLLLVEDDPQIRPVLVECLEYDGLHVVEADTAEAAAALLEDGLQPSLVVTDINLGPGESGLGLADRVRRAHPGIPVVFITARMDMLHQRGLKAGEYVVAKPFLLSALMTIIRKIIPL